MADKANEGWLTAEERSAYEYALTVGTVVSVFRSKARARLAASERRPPPGQSAALAGR